MGPRRPSRSAHADLDASPGRRGAAYGSGARARRAGHVSAQPSTGPRQAKAKDAIGARGKPEVREADAARGRRRGSRARLRTCLPPKAPRVIEWGVAGERQGAGPRPSL